MFIYVLNTKLGAYVFYFVCISVHGFGNYISLLIHQKHGWIKKGGTCKWFLYDIFCIQWHIKFQTISKVWEYFVY